MPAACRLQKPEHGGAYAAKASKAVASKAGLSASLPCQCTHISPHSAMATCILGLLLAPVCTFSIFRNTSKLSPITLPKITCLQPHHYLRILHHIPTAARPQNVSRGQAKIKRKAA